MVLTCSSQAQDLGLHRAEAVKQNIELRRRLWSICVILDRWYGPRNLRKRIHLYIFPFSHVQGISHVWPSFHD